MRLSWALYETTPTLMDPSTESGLSTYPYIALISVFASQMALLGFIFSSLFISPGTSHLMVEDYSGTVREREFSKPLNR